MNKTTVTLSRPITVGGVSTAQITLREPTVGTEEDSLNIAIGLGRENNPITAEICAVSMLSGVPYDVLRQLSPLDYDKLRRAYHDYIRPTQPDLPPQETVPMDGAPEKNADPFDAAS